MTHPVGAIEVEVIGNVGAFAASTEAELRATTRGMGQQIDRDMQGITQSATKHGQQFGEQYTRGRDGRLRDNRGKFVAETDRAMAGAAGTAARRGEQAGTAFASRFTGKLSGLGSGITKMLNSALGTNFSGAAWGGAALVGLGAAAIHMAGDFQASMTRLVAAAGESQKAIGIVGQGALQIARDTGTSVKTIASGLYMIESAGYHGAAALTVARAAAEGAKVDMADVGTVANALTTAMIDMHAPTSQAATIMSQLVVAVGHGKMTMDDLAGSLHSVLPNAASLHLSIGQVAGAIATMTAQGISADQATQNLNHAILALAAPTGAQTKAMAAYGLNASVVAQQLGRRGLSGTLQELSAAVLAHMGPAGLTMTAALNSSQIAADKASRMFKTLAPDTQRLAQAFTDGHLSLGQYATAARHLTGEQGILARQWMASYRAAHGFSDLLKSGAPDAQTYQAAMARMTGGQVGLQVALHLTGENMKTYRANIAAVSAAHAEAGNHVADWSIKQKTFNQQMAMLKETVVTAVIALGQRLLPVATQMVTLINSAVVPAIRRLGPVIADIVGSIRAMAEWIGKNRVVVGLFVGIIVGYVAVMKAAAAATFIYRTVVGNAVAMQAALNAAMDANPIGLIVLAIAALAAGIYYAYTHFKTFHDIVDAVGRFIKNVMVPVFHTLLTAAKDTIGWIVDHWKLIATVIIIAAGPVVIGIALMVAAIVLFVTHIKSIVGFFTRMWQDVTAVVAQVVGTVTAAFHAVAHVIASVFDGIVGFVRDHWRLLLFIVTGGVGLIYILIQDHWRKITGLFERGYNDVMGPVRRLWRDVTTFAARIATDVTGFITRMWRDVATVVTRLWHDVTEFFTHLWHDVTGVVGRFITDTVARYVYLWQQITGIVTRIWHDVTGFFIRLGRDVWNIISPFITTLVGGWTRMYHETVNIAQNIWTGVAGFFRRLRTDVAGIWSGIVSDIGKVWGTVESIIAVPVRWVVDNVYDKGIVGIWNAIAGVLHENSMKLSPIHFAAGGVVPGRRSQADNVPILATAGEVVVPTTVVAAHGGPHSLMGSLGMSYRAGGAGEHFAGGGYVPGGRVANRSGSSIGSLAGSAVGGIAHLARGMMAAAVSPEINALLSLADSALGGMGGMGQMMDSLAHSVGRDIINFVKGDDASALKAAAGSVPGDHAALIMQALGLAGVPVTPGNVADVNLIVTHESGWNPNAINLTDINAQQGHPSQGLMQTIPSTFAAYALSGLGGILDPLANLVAGIRYAVANYGSLDAVPGVYGVNHGGAYVGYDTGGLLPPGVTMAYNGTGRAEHVVTGQTMDDVVAAIRAPMRVVDMNGQYVATLANTANLRKGRGA